MREGYLKREQYELWLENGIIWLVYSKVEVDLDLAKQIVRDRLAITNGISRPLLSDAREGISIQKDARSYFSHGDSIKLVSAGALLIKNHIQKLLVNALLTIDKPAIPARIFTSQKDALEWLERYKS